MHDRGVDGLIQCGCSASFDQSFTPVDDCTLGFQFMTPVARCLGGNGFFKTLSCDQPTNEDHKRLLRHNLRTLSDPLGALVLGGLCLSEVSMVLHVGFIKQSTSCAMLLYNRAWQGFLPFRNRLLGDILFRSHDHHHSAALRR